MKFNNLPEKNNSSSFDALKGKLSVHHENAVASINSKLLKLPDSSLRESSLKLLTGGVLLGATFLGSPFGRIELPSNIRFLPKLAQAKTEVKQSLEELLKHPPKEFLPADSFLLTYEKRERLSTWVSGAFGIKATTTLEGNTLPALFGLIGAEQHLRRCPGDTTSDHMRSEDDWGMYFASGMAPLNGAWGLLAPSKAKLNASNVATERYYAVVQTYLIPEWNQNWTFLKEWYKYRKVIIVNTQTNQACVAAIADSGPSVWTGKVFGGSPEVMEAIGLAKGPRKGPVVVLFVDDPKNQVPLGPIPFAEAIKYV